MRRRAYTSPGRRARNKRAAQGMLEAPLKKLGRMPKVVPGHPHGPIRQQRNSNYRTPSGVPVRPRRRYRA